MSYYRKRGQKHDTIVKFVPKERLDSMSETGHHQGVMAYAAAYEYAEVEDILKIAEEKANRRFCSCLTELRIRITLERSSVPRTLRALTE